MTERTQRYVVKARADRSYWYPDWLVVTASNGRSLAECWSKRSADRICRLLNMESADD